MKKLLSMLLALCVLFSAAAFAEEEVDLSLVDVKERGALRVGMDAQYPPFCFRDEAGEFTGYDVDFAYAIADALGVALEIVPVKWSEKEQALETGMADMLLCGLAQMTGEENALRYSFPYLETSTALVVKGDGAYASSADLAGKTLGVRAGSCETEALLDDQTLYNSLSAAYTFETAYELLNSVETGALDAALADRLAVEYRMEQGGNLKIIEEPEAVWQLVGAFPYESYALWEAVDSALVTLAFNGVLSEITTEWFGRDISILAWHIFSMEEANADEE